MDLLRDDNKYIWHPLTQHQTSADPIPLVKAKGAVLCDAQGKEYIDGIASWYTAMYGHCNDYIVEAAHRQMQTMDQVVFSGFTHEPAVRLSKMLLELLPSNQQKVFFNDNGSTSVEAALKMALQYYHNRGEKRTTFIALEEGFHGDTFGAMSTSGLSVYNGPFEDVFVDVKRIPVPSEDNLEKVQAQLLRIIQEHACAAFIYEPLVQGAAGMTMHQPEHLEVLLNICSENDVLTIADEVMTGFGKTGKHFASLHLNTFPDIICLSKSLTAGMVPMGITSCSQKIFDAFLDEEIAKGFFHAHTYSANPIACACAIAGMELLTSEAIQNDIARISMRHREFKQTIVDHPKVASVRHMGVILAVDIKLEMARYGDMRNRIFNYCMDQGVFLRPLGNTLYTLPPFITNDEQLAHIYSTIEGAISLI